MESQNKELYKKSLKLLVAEDVQHLLANLKYLSFKHVGNQVVRLNDNLSIPIFQIMW